MCSARSQAGFVCSTICSRCVYKIVFLANIGNLCAIHGARASPALRATRLTEQIAAFCVRRLASRSHLPWANVACELPGAVFASLNRLQELNLANNALRGALPPTLWRLPSLRSLSLQGNKITDLGLGGRAKTSAAVASIGASGDKRRAEPPLAPALRHLDVSGNALGGRLPTELGRIVSLQDLVLSANSLRGALPEDVFLQLRALQNIDLGENQLSGSLPSALGLLPALVALDLAGNRFSGTIPNTFWSADDESSERSVLPELVVLDLARNRLNGR